MERFPIGEQRAAEKKYFEFLRTGQMSAGVYRLAAGAVEVLLVPAREAHRFYEIAEELELLVLFAPRESD